MHICPHCIGNLIILSGFSAPILYIIYGHALDKCQKYGILAEKEGASHEEKEETKV